MKGVSVVSQVATKNIPWPKDVVRRVSINTTGYGGTDAHVVIENVDDVLAKVTNGTTGRVYKSVDDTSNRLSRSTNGISNGVSHPPNTSIGVVDNPCEVPRVF